MELFSFSWGCMANTFGTTEVVSLVALTLWGTFGKVP